MDQRMCDDAFLHKDCGLHNHDHDHHDHHHHNDSVSSEKIDGLFNVKWKGEREKISLIDLVII